MSTTTTVVDLAGLPSVSLMAIAVVFDTRLPNQADDATMELLDTVNALLLDRSEHRFCPTHLQVHAPYCEECEHLEQEGRPRHDTEALDMLAGVIREHGTWDADLCSPVLDLIRATGRDVDGEDQ